MSVNTLVQRGRSSWAVCHPERSEGSRRRDAPDAEILRSAQDDKPPRNLRLRVLGISGIGAPDERPEVDAASGSADRALATLVRAVGDRDLYTACHCVRV